MQKATKPQKVTECAKCHSREVEQRLPCFVSVNYWRFVEVDWEATPLYNGAVWCPTCKDDVATIEVVEK